VQLLAYDTCSGAQCVCDTSPQFECCEGKLQCDVNGIWDCTEGPSNACPIPPPNPWDCTAGYEWQCTCAGWECEGVECPIVLDPFNEGFHLTDIANGVKFLTAPGGPAVQTSWTDPNWRNGWLALDRNGNGTIDNFTELFGNLTPQPPSSNPNGFLALAVFDDPKNGGNGNGFIDPGDAVYSHLWVWIDCRVLGLSVPILPQFRSDSQRDPIKGRRRRSRGLPPHAAFHTSVG
jgi:hypothetical protein